MKPEIILTKNLEFDFDLSELGRWDRRPPPFAQLDGLFWADPYLGSHVLFAHLDSSTDDASKPFHEVADQADWLDQLGRRNNLGKPGRALDLGCGPGLHVRELSRKGWKITGLDISEASIRFAKQENADENLDAEFVQGDLHLVPFPENLDLIVLLYGTFGTFSPDQTRSFLDRCWTALRPGGLLIFDTFGKDWWLKEQTRFEPQGWGAFRREGFWAPGPHLVLNRRYVYPRVRTFARIWTIVEPDRVRRFAFWYRWHSSAHLRSLLGTRWSWTEDLTLPHTSPWITVTARKEEPFGPEQSF
ncbi:MAG: class I SAM-dependent methyltransferase [Spirochaetales bacterium]|nr:class I SAM-dependent methyltransferase [Spirochaetales bacterium]